jgi:replicative DNA helicase
MLQMVRAAASAGKTVNFYNLEMTNTEMAQRFLYATERITPAQMARADVDWQSFEIASGQFASKPIYLSDTIFSEDEIIANITLNAQSGKCDIVFIDYLGLVMFSDTKAQQYMAIAGFTKRLKKLAKTCKVPIVLLCQLNRLSASEKRSPQLYDLRDSGSIEQDADIVLMLERASGTLDDNEVYMWVRKNRQGKAGEVKVEIVGNETFTAFTDKNAPTPPPMSSQSWVSDFDNDNDDIPF